MMKEELEMVYKVMAKRDTEIHKLKSNKKVQSYNLLKSEYNKLKDMVRNYSKASRTTLTSPKRRNVGKILQKDSSIIMTQ